MDHPVYDFLERQESLGHISGEYWSTRPYTYTQINTMLAELASKPAELTAMDQRILQRFQQEFKRSLDEDGITFPWSRSTLAGLRHPDAQPVKPLFMTYKQGQTSGWISWGETFRLQHNGSAARGYYTDQLGIFGEKGRIAFTTQYLFHRITKTEAFSDLPDTYREGYVLQRDYIDWISWGYPVSSLVYTHPDFSLSIHRQPVYWGYSPDNSPILSDNVSPLPYLQWTTHTAHLRYKFMHARLSPNTPPRPDTVNVRRNLAAQRVEFDLSPDFEFAFNELVVYAYRDFELGYLNPVTFLYAEEQIQGDLDNKLMALDFKWRMLPGLTSYGTWFFDELDFWKLFSGWWGNKFVFQIGATYYPQSNLPSLNVEYTAARPWTYSHIDPVNSYTSAGRTLGLKYGPNGGILSFGSQWQINEKLFLRGEYVELWQGTEAGGNPLESYISHSENLADNAHFLNGKIQKSSQVHLSLAYYLSSLTTVQVIWEGDQQLQVEIQLNW